MEIKDLLFMLIYFTGLFSFITNRKHLLLLLLSLEFIMLGLYLGLFTWLVMSFINVFFCLIYLTVVVCEGVLGMTIMVMMIRVSGGDYVMSMTMLW